MQVVARKELRSRMRGGRAFAVLSVYLLLLTCLVVAVYAFTKNVIGNQEFGGPPPPLGRILFYAVTLVELMLIAPLAPAFTANSIAGERERQTFDLVMTTPLRARSFVLGKLVSGLSYTLLLVFVALPVQVLALLFGGLSLTEVLLGFWTLIVACIFYASSSLFFSAVMKSTTTASIFSYLTVALSLIGAVFVFFVGIFGSGFLGIPFFFGGPEGGPTATLYYVGLLFVSLSPVTAGGFSAAALIANEGAFILRLPIERFGPNGPIQQGEVLLVSPWVTYSLIYLGLSALLVWLSVRSVRPTTARNPARPTRPPAAIIDPADAS